MSSTLKNPAKIPAVQRNPVAQAELCRRFVSKSHYDRRLNRMERVYPNRLPVPPSMLTDCVARFIKQRVEVVLVDSSMELTLSVGGAA
ncbi:hypothetical protein Pla52o_15930 [Novipirellula galeiformis]|uniref:Uncharacterized protein n=1 Tax=Novipirellula galeiformis TaxID=2528004 RepID=A0A5C6CP91_9BACT|nr:hypothetical protein Pla52o_15930 [Novipirellula galeiformis]